MVGKDIELFKLLCLKWACPEADTHVNRTPSPCSMAYACSCWLRPAGGVPTSYFATSLAASPQSFSACCCSRAGLGRGCSVHRRVVAGVEWV